MAVRVALLAVLALLSGCVTTLNGPSFSEAPAPETDRALVYIYRVNAPPYLYSAAISLDGTKIVNLANRGYTYVYLTSGEYQMLSEWSSFAGAPRLQGKFSFRSGRTYYVRLSGTIESRVRELINYSRLQTVEPQTALQEIHACMFQEPEVSKLVAANAIPDSRGMTMDDLKDLLPEGR